MIHLIVSLSNKSVHLSFFLLVWTWEYCMWMYREKMRGEAPENL